MCSSDLDQGHRNISYLGVPHSDVTTGKRRHEAYLAFCKVHKLHPVAALPGLAMKQGYENVAKVITPETTALLCATDTLALGASKYLQEQRIETLQLASVGNTPLMKFLHPEIVTVDPGYAEAGVGETPLSLVYGMKVVLPIEVQIPSLRIMKDAGLSEDEWVQTRLD